MSDVAARAAYFVGDVAYGIPLMIPLMASDTYFDMIPIIHPLEEEADEDQQDGIEDLPDLESIYAGNEAMEPFYLYNLDIMFHVENLRMQMIDADDKIKIYHRTGECLTNIHEDKRHFVIGNNGAEVVHGSITLFH